MATAVSSGVPSRDIRKRGNNLSSEPAYSSLSEKEQEILSSPAKTKEDLKGKEYDGSLIRDWKTVEAILAPIIFTGLALFTRLYQIGKSNTVTWDEAHFGKFGSYYLKREYYFDVHPPLGKMLVGLSGYIAGYNGSFGFDSGATYPEDLDYTTMRVFNAMFNVFCVPLAYYTAKQFRLSLPAVWLVTLMILFENSYITLGKFILLDSMLAFFTFATVLCFSRFHNLQRKSFSAEWWSWILLTGVSIGCVCSVKMVGLFVTAVIGVYTVADLWIKFGDTKMPIKTYLAHWGARIVSFIIIPFCIFALCFKIHFVILNHTGPGDSNMSSLFQANLIGSDMVSGPANIAFGSKVTIKSQGLNGGLLHSHVQTYPEGSGQQQVTTYHHKDNNNNWLIDTPRPEPYYTDESEIVFIGEGDHIRLLHPGTGNHLTSLSEYYRHSFIPAMTLQLLKSFFVYNELEQSILSDYGDPPFILKHSTIRNFAISPTLSLKLRVFQSPHPKGHKLPSLPLIFLIHGLGGQLNQFQYLIDNFSHFSEVLAIDLPGHGRSEYKSDWQIYEPDHLVKVLETVLLACVPESGREVVLVGHSMGCILASKLANKLGIRCVGLVGICPPGGTPEDKKKIQDLQRVLYYMPSFIFNMFRAVDRAGGLHSKSVSRMVSPATESDELRVKQIRWNLQVNTNAWIRTAYSLRTPTRQEWHELDMPVYMIGAEDDQVTSPANIEVIRSWLGPKSLDIEHTIIHDAGHACIIEKPEVICGLISDFISKSIDVKLSLGWQLAFLASKMDKWSLKNEDKWRRVQSVSARLEGTFFRGMKTLRQDDETHSPARLEEAYPDITDVIDISREAPPYDPTTFQRIRYHKFPTVSKLPPTREEVKAFISLVDNDILAAHKQEATEKEIVVAVHCHYGFNRTGFFLCCYMIERLGFSIKQAIQAFQDARDPGIKHSHFIDELHVRYEL